MKMKINLDALGVTASLLCAVHCLVMPLVLAVSPIVSEHAEGHESFEGIIIACTLILGTWSLIHGWRKHHGKWFLLPLFASGFAGLLASHYWINDGWSVPVLILSITVIIYVHVHNWWLGRKIAH